MFLKKSKKTYKGSVYETYALTESFRHEGKVKHRNICNLGSLTEEQAARIRLVLRVQQTEDVFVGDLSDVVAKHHFRFLDIMVLDHFWRQFDLHHFFQDLPLAEALSINRCVHPKSKIQIHHWVEKTVLPRLLGLSSDSNDAYGIYRVLDKITDQEAELQTHIYKKLKQRGETADQAVFYDITSSYFEGTKCILAAYGYSRDHRRDRLQVTIALVITPQGYPLYWKVMPGNTTDVTTIEGVLHDIEQRFGLTECLLVFDRGMVSEDNLCEITSQKLTYISAIDRDEIPKLHLLPPDFQDQVKKEGWRPKLLHQGFQAYDEQLLYRERVRNQRRYIVAFDERLYTDQQRNRQQQFQKAKELLKQLNAELEQAQKSRDKEKTARKIERELKKLNMHKVFAWKLEPLTMTIVTPKGKERTVNTFLVSYFIEEEVLNLQAKLDGVTCFVTNQPTDKLTAAGAIEYYRRKNKVEEAFREMKEFLNLRPFFLSREKRVKAHVSICVLGYLLLNAMEQTLRHHNEPRSVKVILEELGECLLNRIGPKDGSDFKESITEVTEEQLTLLGKLNCEHLIAKKQLKQIMV